MRVVLGVVEPQHLGALRVVHVLGVVVVLVHELLHRHLVVLLARVEHIVQLQRA